MKIICFIDSLNSGGAQRQMVNLALGFHEKGNEVIVMNYHELHFYKPLLEEYNIPVKTIIKSNYLRRIFEIRQVIRNEKPDVVLSFLRVPNFIATLAGFPFRRWKLILGERNAKPSILKSKKLKFLTFFHVFADYVVANSYTNLELVKKINPFLETKKLKVIYNIVNLPDQPNEEILKISNKTRIVIAARYNPQKNLEGLIEAVKRLPENYQQKLQIDWYGDIQEDEKYYLENKKDVFKSNLKEIIRLHGRVKEVFKEYAQADFVGLFSHYEGFPNTICEAMAVGKPLVVTTVSDVPNFVKEGVNGFLCDSSCVKSIKEAIIRALNSNEGIREKMGENNKKIAKQHFNKENILQEYLNLMSNE